MAFCNQTAEMFAFSGVRSGDTGSYISCLSLWAPSTGGAIALSDAGRYCVVMGGGDIRPPPILGLCVPSNCEPHDVVRYVSSTAANIFIRNPFNASVAHGAVTAYCSDDEVDVESRRLGIGMLVVLVLLLALVFVCTAYDYVYGLTESIKRNKERLSTALMGRRAMLALQQQQQVLMQHQHRQALIESAEKEGFVVNSDAALTGGSQKRYTSMVSFANDSLHNYNVEGTATHAGELSGNSKTRSNSNNLAVTNLTTTDALPSSAMDTDPTAAPSSSSPLLHSSGRGIASPTSLAVTIPGGGPTIPIAVGLGVLPTYQTPAAPSYYRLALEEAAAAEAEHELSSSEDEATEDENAAAGDGVGIHRHRHQHQQVQRHNSSTSSRPNNSFRTANRHRRASRHRAVDKVHEAKESNKQQGDNEGPEEKRLDNAAPVATTTEGDESKISVVEEEDEPAMYVHRGDSSATIELPATTTTTTRGRRHGKKSRGRGTAGRVPSMDSSSQAMGTVVGDDSENGYSQESGEEYAEEGSTDLAVGKQPFTAATRTDDTKVRGVGGAVVLSIPSDGEGVRHLSPRANEGTTRESSQHGEKSASNTNNKKTIRGIIESVAASIISRRESTSAPPSSSKRRRKDRRVNIGDGLSQPLFLSDSEDSSEFSLSTSSSHNSQDDCDREERGKSNNSRKHPGLRRHREGENEEGGQGGAASNLQGGSEGPTAAMYRRSREIFHQGKLHHYGKLGSPHTTKSSLKGRKNVEFADHTNEQRGGGLSGLWARRSRTGVGGLTSTSVSASRRLIGRGPTRMGRNKSPQTNLQTSSNANGAGTTSTPASLSIAFAQRFTDYADAHLTHELEEGDLTRSEKVRTQIALHMERIIDDMPNLDSVVARVVRTWSLIAGFARWRQQEGMGGVVTPIAAVGAGQTGSAVTVGSGGSNLRLFNSIRTLCWVWIVVTDTFEYTTQIPTYEGVLKTQTNPVYAFLDRKACDTFAIGTFLMVSGFTVIHQLRDEEKQRGKDPVTIAKKKFASFPSKAKTALKWYFARLARRWVRLVPLYLAIVFLSQATLLTHDAGAFWSAFLQNNALHGNCVKRFFFTNILFINNLYPLDMKSRCFPWTFYFALDFQFFAFAPIFHYIHSMTAKSVFYPLVVLLCAGTVYARYTSQTPCDEQNLLDAEVSDGLVPLHSEFTTPWTMFVPYVFGSVLCYFHAATINKAQEIKMFGPQAMRLLRYSFKHTASPGDKAVYWLLERLNSKPFRVLCIWGGLIISMGTLMGSWLVNREHVDAPCSFLGRLFAAFSVLPWCFGVFFCFLPMLFGYGGSIQRVLTHRLWMNSSKLIFAAYLAHPVVISIVNCIKDHPQTFEAFPFVYEVWGNVTFSIIIAFLFHLVIEQPFMYMVSDVVEM